MGKFRSKLKGRSKGKRWAKGQSSNSNPETNKYRKLAKSRFFQEQIGSKTSNLTIDALRQHETNMVNNFSMMQVDDNNIDEKSTKTLSKHSLDFDKFTWKSGSTFKTFDTFASDWSECTNKSFSKLLTFFKPDSALHKDMLAILAATTEVIKSKGGSGSSTEYYAALMTTLELSKTDESIAATLQLLSMGLGSVPSNVLKLQFNSASKIILDIFEKYKENISDNQLILKALFKCFEIFLIAQDVNFWKSDSNLKLMFNILISFTINSKPKLRKSAQQSVVKIIYRKLINAESNKSPDKYYVSDLVCQFCCEQINAHIGEIGGQTTVLHVLTLLKDIIKVCSPQKLKITCETLLKIMTLNEPMISVNALNVLNSLLSGKQTTLTVNLNKQLIVALYDFQPSATDVTHILCWTQVMQNAHVHLADLDILEVVVYLEKFISSLMELWLVENQQLANGIFYNLDNVWRDCIGPINELPENKSKLVFEKHEAIIKNCFLLVENCLSYQYNNVWTQVLKLIANIFEVTGQGPCKEYTKSILVKLASIRDSNTSSFNLHIEYAIGAAVRFIGPELVLEVIRVFEKDRVILDRSWMLPILKDNVKFGNLTYFWNTIMPLCILYQKKYMDLIKLNPEHKSNEAHTIGLMCCQLWSLLSNFCNNAPDIGDKFKNMAKLLGITLNGNKDVRLSILSALRKIIVQSKNNDQDCAEVARFAKNFLPILFNIYTTQPSLVDKKTLNTEEEGIRLSTFETIKLYYSIAPKELQIELYTKAIELLEATQDDVFTRQAIFDLIRLMVVYQPSDAIELLYNNLIENLSKDKKEQKKVYRLLEDILLSKNKFDECQIFFEKNRSSIEQFLLGALTKTHNTSKTARLRCMTLIIQSRGENKKLDGNSKLVKNAIAEAILCVKDLNERCRESSKKLLIYLGEYLYSNKQGDLYLALILTGLASVDHQLLVATLYTITMLLKHFTLAVGSENIKLIFQTVTSLIERNSQNDMNSKENLNIKSREIIKNGIEFLKTFFACMPLQYCNEFLARIVQTLSKLSDDCKSHFRIDLGNFYAKLMRKFTYELIVSFVPENDTITLKRLRNINKIERRKKRMKEIEEKQTKDEQSVAEEESVFSGKKKERTIEEILADSSSDSDDDETEKNESVSIKKGKQRTPKRWIQETEDDIIDFTDTATISKITMSKPKTQTNIPKTLEQTKKKSSDFKTAPDGRLIIMNQNDSDSDDDDQMKIDLNSDSDSDDDKKSKKSGKSKKSSKSGKSIKTTTTVPASQFSCYKPSGSGIHRNTKLNPSTKHLLKDGSEFKSKKAKGDVKRKGQIEPYAYIPLSRSALNKRKKRDQLVANKFKNLIKKSKKYEKTKSYDEDE